MIAEDIDQVHRLGYKSARPIWMARNVEYQATNAIALPAPGGNSKAGTPEVMIVVEYWVEILVMCIDAPLVNVVVLEVVILYLPMTRTSGSLICVRPRI
jgi:hypothetical protein